MAGNTPGGLSTQIRPWYAPIENGLGEVTDALKEGREAAGDMKRNYEDMRQADTKNADKYFHCRGNCEAAQRGPIGAGVAATLAELREVYGMFKGDPAWDRAYDQYANRLGRSSPLDPGFQSCKASCDPFAPSALSEKYRSKP